MKKTTLLLVCGLIVTTVFSCKKSPNTAPVIKTTTEYDNNWGSNSGGTVTKVTFVPVTGDPYSGAVIVGGASYIYLTKPINKDYTFQGYLIYLNRSTTAGSNIYNDAKTNVYYNPAETPFTIKFGTAVTANVVDFCTAVNAAITKNKGYAVISHFVDGGAANEDWKIVL